MKAAWQISSGQIPIPRETNSQYHRGTNPSPSFEHDPSFEINSFSDIRGAGYQFGAQIVEKFLHVNKMVHILRAHQLCNEGFQVFSPFLLYLVSFFAASSSILLLLVSPLS